MKVRDAWFLEQLLAFGESVHSLGGCEKTALGLALDLQHAEHLRLLVLHAANLDEHPVIVNSVTGSSYISDRSVRQTISDLPVRTPGAALKTAMAQGLADRLHLVVSILAHLAPAMSQDNMQLICQYADLMF